MSDLKTIQDLLIEAMKDALDAETQLVEALPNVANAAHSPALKKAVRAHLSETKEHANRLEQAFQLLGMEAKSKKCKGMAGLIKECEEAAKAGGSHTLVDAAIVSAAQKVEHYEIAAYRAMLSYAKLLDEGELIELFEMSLDEEQSVDGELAAIATNDLLKKSLPDEVVS